MERITLTSTNVQAAADRAAEVLRNGGIVLYPTDTLYGLGADALSDAAVEKIFEIKGRDEHKPIHAILADIDAATAYGTVSGVARLLEDEMPKGKITYIVPKKDSMTTGISKGMETFGFRIPDSELCKTMVRTFGGPITATSANISGKVPQRTVDSILEQLGEKASLVDLAIDGGELPESQPSTVINLTQGHPLILREGAVAPAEIWNALQ